MGNSTKYAEVLEDIITLKDAVFEKNTANSLVEMQAKYEVQKKENTIIKQRLDLVTKNYWLYGSIILSFFIAMLFYILFKNYRKKQKLTMGILLAEEKQLAIVSVKEAQENERKRIAADLHDNLGAYAAAISSNVDYLSVAQTAAGDQNIFEELTSNAQAIVAQLNDTIWILTKEELALTAVSDRLKVFIQRLLNSYSTVQIDVIEKIEMDHLLPPMQAFHLFKILQEGITNALKHSNCSKITISIESYINWQIVIKDDGNGLAANVAKTFGGNGLHNMKKRSLEAGWLISWQQIEPSGTKVIIAATTN
jgi:signal transduction histidine kinase